MAFESGVIRSAASRLGLVVACERVAAFGHTYGAAERSRKQKTEHAELGKTRTCGRLGTVLNRFQRLPLCGWLCLLGVALHLTAAFASLRHDSQLSPLGARSVGRTYDELGRVKTYTNAEGEMLKYLWDENGNLRFLEYPDTNRVEYQYDERDRLQYVKEAGVTMAEFQWTIANQLKKIIRANGTVRELFYDAANRLERIEERGPDGRLFYYQRREMTSVCNKLTTENAEASNPEPTGSSLGKAGLR
ncbi:MAG: RHS repeat protein [Verrucomicrobiaceae bacterium]|nr:RHS repeat protein [Verrucomicrobiaceae bacterium]